MRAEPYSLMFRIANLQIVRLIVLGVLTLLLLIPLAMIGGLISERQERSHSAVAEVTSKWGGSQTVVGPALVLPFGDRNARSNAVFLPKALRITGQIASEDRQRGIFHIPIYRFQMKLDGEFEKPRLETVGLDPNSVLWNMAHLSVGISDVSSLQDASRLTWNGVDSEFLQGSDGLLDSIPGLHSPVAASPQDSSFKFSFPLSLNGSDSVYLTPFGEETVVRLSGNSTHPEFQGNWLPSERTIRNDGFDATWRVSYLARNYPQAWIKHDNITKSISASQFGVKLNPPMDLYRLSDRSVKYAVLFIILTFASVWVCEVLSRSRVHPIQYLMLGFAMCMFYVLELSLSEHLGFPLAYAIASAAVILLISLYAKSVFRGGLKNLTVGTGVSLLYSYLYVVLTNEDAALLVGSIGLFIILAAIMFATRTINWSAEPSESEAVKL